MGPLEKHLYVSINGKVRNKSEKGEGIRSVGGRCGF